MKNLFLALALTGFVGAASLGTASAFAPSKVITCGGEECKKDKKCKKGADCCKAKSTANTEKKCSKEGAKKCCSSATSQSKTTTAQPAPANVKPDTKATEAVK